jgi:hypothetical protein
MFTVVPKSQAVRIHQERNRNKIRKLMLVIATKQPTFFEFYLLVVPMGLDETLWPVWALKSIFDQAQGQVVNPSQLDIEDYTGTVTASSEAHYYARGYL